MTRRPDIEVAGRADLESVDQSTPGVTREVVFDTDDALLERTRYATDASLGWRHHGERDAAGVVLDGALRVEYGTDEPGAGEAGTREAGIDALRIEAGEFFYLPAGVVHRDVAAAGETVVVTAFVGPGEPEIAVDGPAPVSAENRPRRAGEDDLVAADALANLTRLTPFPDAPVQQVRGHASGRIESDWHHHGDNDVLGYVLRGEGYVEWGPGEDERALARAEEFFRVPAGVVHRDVNPSDDEQDYVLWLTGSDPRTVPADEPAGGE